MTLVAQQERQTISMRTKEALKAAKARGKVLGNPNGAAALRRAGKSNHSATGATKGARGRARQQTVRQLQGAHYLVGCYRGSPLLEEVNQSVARNTSVTEKWRIVTNSPNLRQDWCTVHALPPLLSRHGILV